MATASQVHLSLEHPGYINTPLKDVNASLEAASHYLQKNHEQHHMFWRAVAGHNHITHSVLNTFALGGGPSDLQRAFDDGADIQRSIPSPALDDINVLSDTDKFYAHMGNLDHYPDFLAFFAKEIETRGWIEVVQEYCFSKTRIAERMFAQLFEGLYHPLIHLGLGVEFKQPTIIAEGLAQTASHDSMGVETYFVLSEQEALKTTKSAKPLVQLLQAVRDNEGLREAPVGHPDGPTRVRDGVLSPQTQDSIVEIAAQFKVTDFRQGLVETINSSAFTTGAAQKPGKERKVDFFHMHAVTASIALTVMLEQSWITEADKVRLVEWKGRVDLVWYAASGSVELRLNDIVNYSPDRSAGMDWDGVFKAVLKVHDDGHLAKLVRALKSGEATTKSMPDTASQVFVLPEGAWLKIAQMGYDSTVDRDIMDKWIWGVGFEEYWANVPELKRVDSPTQM